MFSFYTFLLPIFLAFATRIPLLALIIHDVIIITSIIVYHCQSLLVIRTDSLDKCRLSGSWFIEALLYILSFYRSSIATVLYTADTSEAHSGYSDVASPSGSTCEIKQ